MNTPSSFRTGLLFTALACCAPAAWAQPVFSDSFEDGDPRLADSQPEFWSIVQQDGNLDSHATEQGGVLRLRAATWANSHIALISQPLEDFGFFTKTVTVTLEGIALEAKGIAANEARFELSVAATPDRSEKAADVISLRLRPGLLLFGYRVDGFDLGSGPETLAGQHVNSIILQEIPAMPTKLSLTLGPAQRPGHVRFEIAAEGNGVSVLRTGVLALSLANWGNNDSASISIQARRDSGAAGAGTYTELSVGKITVSR